VNDASRGGLRLSSLERCRKAVRWVRRCGIWTATGQSRALWGWLRRWQGFWWPGAIHTTLVGGLCVRLSWIRWPTHRGRGARGVQYRWSLRISSGLPGALAGCIWRALNISPLSAARSRSLVMLIRPP